MKPLGLYFSISSKPGEPRGFDDDHDWHLRQAASQRASSAPTIRKRASAVTERLVALARLVRPRSGAATARRI